MDRLSIRDARAKLSQLIDAIDTGEASGFVITKHGRDAVQITALSAEELPSAKTEEKVPPDVERQWRIEQDKARQRQIDDVLRGVVRKK
jgi:prevent-host-death family protein